MNPTVSAHQQAELVERSEGVLKRSMNAVVILDSQNKQ